MNQLQSILPSIKVILWGLMILSTPFLSLWFTKGANKSWRNFWLGVTGLNVMCHATLLYLLSLPSEGFEGIGYVVMFLVPIGILNYLTLGGAIFIGLKYFKHFTQHSIPKNSILHKKLPGPTIIWIIFILLAILLLPIPIYYLSHFLYSIQ